MMHMYDMNMQRAFKSSPTQLTVHQAAGLAVDADAAAVLNTCATGHPPVQAHITYFCSTYILQCMHTYTTHEINDITRASHKAVHLYCTVVLLNTSDTYINTHGLERPVNVCLLTPVVNMD
jgi:hypothetical protein